MKVIVASNPIPTSFTNSVLLTMVSTIMNMEYWWKDTDITTAITQGQTVPMSLYPPQSLHKYKVRPLT
jgi:hypothetical protein